MARAFRDYALTLIDTIRATFDPGGNLPADCAEWAAQHEGAIAQLETVIQGLPTPMLSEGEDLRVEIASIVSGRTKRGLVELTLNGKSLQLELAKAREIAGMLQGAIEAAVSDELLVRFLEERIELTPQAAAAALLDFREMRQGSRNTVFPS